jgi:ABC-type antimicrobial peptide transport system permease subunit
MSHSLIKKSWRELTGRRGRSLLTLLGLVVGLWGVGSVAVAWYVLGQDMRANFLSTNPPAIAMTIEGPAPVNLGDLGVIEGVNAVENRPQISGRVEIAPDTWLPLVLWVVDDFDRMEVARILPETGILPPPGGTFAMERDGLPFVNFLRARAQASGSGQSSHRVQVPASLERFENSDITLTLAGGHEVTARLSGTVFDPAQAPSRMEQVLYGYISPDTARAWTGGDYQQRLLVVTEDAHHAAAIAATAARVESRLQALGYTVLATRYPSATEHVHQFQMNSILFLLTGLGVLALLMSVVLVVNLVNGMLTSQVRQIGILKAIGGSTAQISLIFLGAMWLLGLVAGLAAWPLVLNSGYSIAGGLSAFLNFEVLTTSLPPAFGVGFVILGSLFPVAAALATVRHWCSLPATDALRYAGVNLRQGQASLPSLPLPVNVQMGLRNAARKPGRTALTAITLAIGVTIFMAALNMRSSLLHTADTEESLKGFDVIVSFEQPIAPERVAFMGMFGIVERAETWRVLAASVDDPDAPSSNPLPLYLVPDDSDALRPSLLAGDWLGEVDGAVINQRLQNDYPRLTAGSTLDITVEGTQLQLPVIGVMKEFGGAAIYLPADAYRALVPTTGTLVNTGFVGLKEPNEKNLGLLMRNLESHFDTAGVAVRDIRSAKLASRVIRGHLDVIVATLLVVAVFMLLVSSLGMASAMAATVVERTRELGVLRAIGGQPAAIRTLLGSESLAIALLGWLLALLAAQPVSRALSDYFGTALVEYPFDYQGSLAGAGLSLALTILLSGLATLAPARLATRQPIRQAIAYE